MIESIHRPLGLAKTKKSCCVVALFCEFINIFPLVCKESRNFTASFFDKNIVL